MEDFKSALEDLFAEGFRDFPTANPAKAESQPYALGFTAHAQIDELEHQRAAIFAKARELSGGAVGRAGFVA